MNRRDCVPAMMIAAGAALALLGILLSGCATAPPPSPPVAPVADPLFGPDIEKMVPPPEAAPDLSKLPAFEDLPVDDDTCPTLPAGILVSERTYAQRLWDEAELARVTKELSALKVVRTEDVAAFSKFVNEAAKVARQTEQSLNNERRWRYAWIAIGFLTGTAVSVGLARSMR